ncbi:MAG: HEAT repeat domain-containing protein [Planctomycetota bacterium]|jgi:HEAT repeat protein
MLPSLAALALTLLPLQADGDQQASAPQAPLPSLEEQLEDFDRLRRSGSDPKEAVERLHDIGRLHSEEAVDALLRLIPKLEGTLAQAAVHAVAMNETEYAHDKLLRLARDRTHPAVRRQACLDLARGSRDDLEFLRDKRLKAEKDLRIRGEILRNLIDHDVDRLEKTVLKAAKSKDNIYAGVGVYGIGVLRLEKGLRTVESYLTSPDLQLRLAAFRALANFGGAESFRTLLRAFAHANNLALQPDIEILLQAADDMTEVDVLIQEGLRHEDPAVVMVAASALSMASAKQPDLCAPVMLDLLDHHRSRIRDFAIEGLVRAHPDDVLEVLIQQLAHEDARTRTTAAWALAQLGDLPEHLAPQLVMLASDTRAPIRLHVVDALRCFPDSEDAFQAALGLLEDPIWSVRAAAVATLQLFRRTESVGPLVLRVDEETGRVRDDAVEALCQLTGEDFGPALGTWRLWFEDLPEDYVLPDAATAAENLAQRRKRRAKGHDSVATSVYHGIQVPQGGVVFVLDVSGSMAEHFEGGLSYYEHFSSALCDTIDLLNDKTRFSVVLFSSGVQVWRELLVPGTPENADKARGYLENVRPEGPTNLYGALMTALSFQDVQTIFLLTDGDPTFGRIVMPEAILAELDRVNRDRNVVINTIAAGDVRAEFLADLANDNGGAAVDLTDTKE